MDQVLNSLGGLLLKALPTFVLVIFLHFYLKLVFFKPLDKALQQRNEATEGGRKRAELHTEQAAKLSAEYEAAISAVRRDLYQEQEMTRRRWHEERMVAIGQVRQQAAAMVRQAKAQLTEQVIQTKATLASESEQIARKIADRILREGQI
jgi:F-type H+-transporting ATPase subunit b